MNRLVAFWLCLVLLFSFGVVPSVAQSIYTQQTDYSTPLFNIAGANNKGGGEFVTNGIYVRAIRVYLQNGEAGNPITLSIYKGSIGLDSTAPRVVHQQLVLEKAGTGWFTLYFAGGLLTTAGERYSFVLNTQKGAALFGKLSGTASSCLGLNYDASIGGWTRGHEPAFQLMEMVTVQEVEEKINALPQTITLDHELLVNHANNAYNALPFSDRASVTNSDRLTTAVETIETLKNEPRDQAALAIQTALETLEITRNSYNDLKNINEKIVEFGYLYGNYQYTLIPNINTFEEKVAEYNTLIQTPEAPAPKPLYGDVNGDETVDAKDALEVLKASVGKVTLTEAQLLLANVDDSEKIDAKDALMILQYTVGKRNTFPCDKEEEEPPAPQEYPAYEITYNTYSVKGEELFAATYESMVTRTAADGYARTSLTGAYPGMYCRDSSIQIMAHVQNKDFDLARKILTYLTNYHRNNNHSYVIHVIGDTPSLYKQADATFFFLHAWYLFATTAPKTAETKAYIEGSYDMVKRFADYYLDGGNLNNQYGLLYNECFEHSRDGSYWQSYDLITNVYASQALHELATFFASTDPAHANKWQTAADQMVQGVHTHLVTQVDGKTMYRELIGRSYKQLEKDPATAMTPYTGFSWVNLAPMGCDWYGTNEEILANTYELYKTYGSYLYYRRYQMLDVCTMFDANKRPIKNATHVIGKGLAWEMIYCHKIGDTKRLIELTNFVEEFSDTLYRETWLPGGGGNDTGNQEQAGWLLFAHKTVYPNMGTR